MNKNKLPCACGCIPGFFLCQEAIQLWSEVRQLATQYDNDIEYRYREAYERYDRHINPR